MSESQRRLVCNTWFQSCSSLVLGKRLETPNIVLFGISHLVSCPRPAWAFFLIFFLLHRFASPFSDLCIWHTQERAATHLTHQSFSGSLHRMIGRICCGVPLRNRQMALLPVPFLKTEAGLSSPAGSFCSRAGKPLLRFMQAVRPASRLKKKEREFSTRQIKRLRRRGRIERARKVWRVGLRHTRAPSSFEGRTVKFC